VTITGFGRQAARVDRLVGAAVAGSIRQRGRCQFRPGLTAIVDGCPARKGELGDTKAGRPALLPRETMAMLARE